MSYNKNTCLKFFNIIRKFYNIMSSEKKHYIPCTPESDYNFGKKNIEQKYTVQTFH